VRNDILFAVKGELVWQFIINKIKAKTFEVSRSQEHFVGRALWWYSITNGITVLRDYVEQIFAEHQSDLARLTPTRLTLSNRF